MGSVIPGDAYEYDNKNRRNVKQMSDRELLEEICNWQRVTGDTIESFLESMQTNPMLRAFAGKMGR